MTNIIWSQLLRCEGLLLFFVIRDSKLKIFGLMVRQNQNI